MYKILKTVNNFNRGDLVTVLLSQFLKKNLSELLIEKTDNVVCEILKEINKKENILQQRDSDTVKTQFRSFLYDENNTRLMESMPVRQNMKHILVQYPSIDLYVELLNEIEENRLIHFVEKKSPQLWKYIWIEHFHDAKLPIKNLKINNQIDKDILNEINELIKLIIKGTQDSKKEEYLKKMRKVNSALSILLNIR